MDQFILGLDGGGTKTELCAAAPSGQELFRLRGGPLNLNGLNREVVAANIQGLVLEALKRLGGGACAAVCLGAAGISNPEAEPFLLSVLSSVLPGVPSRVVGDFHTAMAGAVGSTQGIILIAGTGSVCFGINTKGDVWRTGGRGHLIDDEGSGYAIGRDILSAVVQAQDMRTPPTLLTELVYRKLGFEQTNIQQLIAEVYQPDRGKDFIASFSSLLPRAATAQDPAALQIVSKAAGELVKLVEPVARRLALENDRLAITGSVLLQDAAIQEAFKAELARVLPQLQIQYPRADAAAGAVLLARGLVG